MYNRYIPQQGDYAPIPPPRTEAPPPRGVGLGGLLGGLLRGEGNGAGKAGQALAALLKNLGLPGLDAGDVLLALIVLFLILEDGDDLELLIALGLTLLLLLGEP